MTGGQWGNFQFELVFLEGSCSYDVISREILMSQQPTGFIPHLIHKLAIR